MYSNKMRIVYIYIFRSTNNCFIIYIRLIVIHLIVTILPVKKNNLHFALAKNAQ